MTAKGDERIELESQPLNTNSVKMEVMTGSNGSNPITITKEKPLPLGLTKDELMKYANDPFWCKLRRTLFALFWCIWVAMLLGAFLIIHYFPACSSSSKLSWFQRSSCSQLDRELFDVQLKDISTNIPAFLNTFEFDSLLFPAPYSLDNSGGVKDFGALNPNWGKLEEFDQLVKTIQSSKKSRVLLDLNLGTTSINHEWFLEFTKGNPNRADFYVTVPENAVLPKLYDSNSFHSSVTQSNQVRVLTKDRRPVLNLFNKNVLAAIKASLRAWTSKGISGFRLSDVPYIVQDAEDQSNLSLDMKRNVELVRDLTNLVKSLKSDAVLIVQFPHDSNIQSNFYGTDSSPVTDAVVSSLISSQPITSLQGDTFYNRLIDTLKGMPVWNPEAPILGPWTAWLVSPPAGLGRDMENFCFRTSLAYLLPRGTPVSFMSSYTLGVSKNEFWNSFTNNTVINSEKVRLFKELKQLRRDHVDSLLLGSLAVPYNDRNVFTLARYSADSKTGFLLLANLNVRNSQTFDLPRETYLPETAHLQFSCSSRRPADQVVSLQQQITLDANELLLLRFSLPA